MSRFNIASDAINAAILKGVSEAIQADLKEYFMKDAEVFVDKVVADVTDRLRLRIESSKEFLTDSRTIKLEVLFKKEVDNA
jgi:hypothetical protein